MTRKGGAGDSLVEAIESIRERMPQTQVCVIVVEGNATHIAHCMDASAALNAYRALSEQMVSLGLNVHAGGTH